MDFGPYAVGVTLVTILLVPAIQWARNVLVLAKFSQNQMSKRGRSLPVSLLFKRPRVLRGILDDLDQDLEELQNSEVQMGQWVSNVAHDLRTPLSAIQGYAGIMEQEAFELSRSDQQRYARAVLGLGNRLQEMVSDLSRVSRWRSGEEIVEMEVISMAEMVYDTAALFSVLIDQKGLQLKRVLPQDLCLVRGDARLVERAVQNLLQNAIRYSVEGGEMAIEARRKGDRVEVKVTNGVAERVPVEGSQLFDRGVRGPQGGQGLGLSIVREIMTLHQGGIRMGDPQPGKITFILCFPAWEPEKV